MVRQAAVELVLWGAGAFAGSAYCCIGSADGRLRSADGRSITQVRQIPIVGFIGTWRGFAFAKSSPGVVLSLPGGKPGADVSRSSSPIRGSKTVAVGSPTRPGALRTVAHNPQGFNAQLDRRVPRRFSAAALCMDQQTALVAGSCMAGMLRRAINDCVVHPCTQGPGRISYADLSGRERSAAAAGRASHAGVRDQLLGSHTSEGADV